MATGVHSRNKESKSARSTLSAPSSLQLANTNLGFDSCTASATPETPHPSLVRDCRSPAPFTEHTSNDGGEQESIARPWPLDLLVSYALTYPAPLTPTRSGQQQDTLLALSPRKPSDGGPGTERQGHRTLSATRACSTGLPFRRLI